MKLLRKLSGHGLVVMGGAFLASLLLAGCRTEEAAFSNTADQSLTVAEAVRFHIGDQVTVTFSGLPPSDVIPPHEERIKEDGTITLALIGAVKAAGKAPGELQKEIQDLYVPKYYLRLTVTVKSQDLVYSVGGEVKSPGPKVYVGETTVTKAIQAAGDFTDFANRKKVKLTRAGAKKPIIVNCVDALNDPSKDPQVFPGDKIDVPRRLL
jgi:polysaccharide biosynthesis/export protein VpsN